MTSSVQPPTLNPSLGTPSDEWAKNTTSTLEPPSQGAPQNTTSGQVTSPSPGVTPGNELPGAFPNRGQGPGEPSTGTTNITETIVDTAKQYFPASVVNTVGNLFGNNNPSGSSGTDQDVRASEHDIYHKASLPSQELRGALPHEHTGGVGSLPGASIEKSVAVLPEQLAEWSECDTFAGRNTPGYQTPNNLKATSTSLSQTATQKATNLAVASGLIKADVPPEPKSEDVGKGDPETLAGGDPEALASGDITAARQAVENIKPVAFDIKPADDASVPSKETQGQQPGESTGGIGSLPGPKDEQGVAVLPEERVTKATDTVLPEESVSKTTETVRPEPREEQGNTTDKTKDEGPGTTGVGVSGATDSLEKDTTSRGAQRSRQFGDPTIQLEPRVHPLGGDASHWNGVSFGRGAAEEWERTAATNNEPPTETTELEKTTTSEPSELPSTSRESGERLGIRRSGASEGGTSEGQQHKATFKEKISGGMKVVSGKLGSDKAKVEEGKKLMHGQGA